MQDREGEDIGNNYLNNLNIRTYSIFYFLNKNQVPVGLICITMK